MTKESSSHRSPEAAEDNKRKFNHQARGDSVSSNHRTNGRNSRRKNQQHKYGKQQQMDAALQDICFSAGKRNHAHRER